jgi:hypothetical protein
MDHHTTFTISEFSNNFQKIKGGSILSPFTGTSELSITYQTKNSVDPDEIHGIV